MRILITLCARGGSKGIPRKNIKELNGQPLITYSIQLAKKIKENYGEVYIELSTDDEEIRQVASYYGLSTEYIRPTSLASDTAGKVDVIRDLVSYSEIKHQCIFDYVLDLDISSPLRTFEDVIDAFSIMTVQLDALTLFSVNAATKNPYFNMVEENEFGYYSLAKSIETTTLSRQSAPIVYELNASFYIYNRNYFNTNWRGVITDKSLIYLMPHICFDLDHPIDFEFMDFLLKNNKLSFEL